MNSNLTCDFLCCRSLPKLRKKKGEIKRSLDYLLKFSGSFNGIYIFRKEQEKLRLIEEERENNLKRTEDEQKQQSLRYAVLGDSIKEFEGKTIYSTRKLLSSFEFKIPRFISENSRTQQIDKKR